MDCGLELGAGRVRLDERQRVVGGVRREQARFHAGGGGSVRDDDRAIDSEECRLAGGRVRGPALRTGDALTPPRGGDLAVGERDLAGDHHGSVGRLALDAAGRDDEAAVLEHDVSEDRVRGVALRGADEAPG